MAGFDNPDELRKRVLAVSSSTGKSVEEISNALFNWQQAVGDLPKQIQKDVWSSSVLLTETKGGSIDTNVRAIQKFWRAYGEKGGFKSVQGATDFLAFMEAESEIEMPHLAENLPDILPTWVQGGYAPKEIAAALKKAQQLNAEGKTVLLDIHSNLEARRSSF